MMVLDLFCGAGGASAGYRRGGAEVIGVDIDTQPEYPYQFWGGDALHILERLIAGAKFRSAISTDDATYGLDDFDFIHASPPCQAYSNAQRLMNNVHPDLIPPTRELLMQTGKPWVIENVVGAPLRNPIMLCGEMFSELRVYRHRLFETSFYIEQPEHPKHVHPIAKMGRMPKAYEYMHVVGNYAGAEQARIAMNINWMNRDGMREAIPPAYSEFILERFQA